MSDPWAIFFGDDNEEDPQDVLKVEEIDFCIESNGEEHNTNKYYLMTRSTDKCLVVRRGQAFKLDILLNRPYDASRDGISFIFNVSDVDRRGPSSGNTVAIALLDEDVVMINEWNVLYEDQDDMHLYVSITPAADCIVAAWQLEVDTKLLEGGALSYKHPQPIYVLFNPWCPNDSVYMPDEDRRYECVLETGGLLFRAFNNDIVDTPWNYAQFGKNILECSLYLVRKVGKVKGRGRADPIQTGRALAAAINDIDDDGVIEGNWGRLLSDYLDGTLPTKWVGSLVILQKYYNTKQPVKYGQCWVYAAVLTTVCRALGIPCRPVTGFNSAHDSDGSLTLDQIVDEDGKPEKHRDTFWNFHVWNEVWMERRDLGPEYNGWQILDGTPQELSDDMYRCGPASLQAIVNGEVQKPYDTGFMFATVNADMVYWKRLGKNKPLKFISHDTVTVGQSISTKAVGRMKREDITHTYKHEENSSVERLTVVNALRLSKSKIARYYLKEIFNDDVTISLKLLDEVLIGQDFSVAVTINNHSSTDHHRVKGILRVDRVTYTGVVGELVRKTDFNVVLGPESNEVVKMLVTFDDYYMPMIADQGLFKMACMATDLKEEFDYYLQDNFRVKNPGIELSIDETPVIDEEFNVTARVENPLPIPLTKCKFYIQAPGLDEQLRIPLEEDVEPGDFATVDFTLSSPWRGSYQISAKFQSWELRDIDGYLTFTVE